MWSMGSLVDGNVIMWYKLITSAKTPLPQRPHSEVDMDFQGVPTRQSFVSSPGGRQEVALICLMVETVAQRPLP